jgi:Holliday junction resolvasome RuvABC ATP-dependent DNA helicase subunit
MNAIMTLISNAKNEAKNLSVLDKVIGQDEARNKLSFFIKSNSDKNCLPTFLFSGSQGLGKTYTAYKVAEALGWQPLTENLQKSTNT